MLGLCSVSVTWRWFGCEHPALHSFIAREPRPRHCLVELAYRT